MLTQTILNIRDQTVMGKVTHEFELSFSTAIITVREVIAERVRKEVDDFIANKKSKGYSLVKPLEVELILNRNKVRKMDPEKQVDIAIEAFQSNGFFMLVNDEQVVDLEHQVFKESTVSFIKLVPLVGG